MASLRGAPAAPRSVCTSETGDSPLSALTLVKLREPLGEAPRDLPTRAHHSQQLLERHAAIRQPQDARALNRRAVSTAEYVPEAALVLRQQRRSFELAIVQLDCAGESGRHTKDRRETRGRHQNAPSPNVSGQGDRLAVPVAASLLWKSASSSRTSCGTTTSYRSKNVFQAHSSCRPMMGPASRIRQRGLLLLTRHRDGVEIARLELEQDVLRGQLGKTLIDTVGGQTRL